MQIGCATRRLRSVLARELANLHVVRRPTKGGEGGGGGKKKKKKEGKLAKETKKMVCLAVASDSHVHGGCAPVGRVEKRIADARKKSRECCKNPGTANRAHCVQPNGGQYRPQRSGDWRIFLRIGRHCWIFQTVFLPYAATKITLVAHLCAYYFILFSFLFSPVHLESLGKSVSRGCTAKTYIYTRSSKSERKNYKDRVDEHDGPLFTRNERFRSGSKEARQEILSHQELATPRPLPERQSNATTTAAPIQAARRYNRLSAPGIPRTVILLNLHINQRILIIPNHRRERETERAGSPKERSGGQRDWRRERGGKRETIAKTEKVKEQR